MKNIIFILLIIFFAIDAYAFRCGQEIVSKGDTAYEVLLKCGQPQRKEYIHFNANGIMKYAAKWYYNCGENDFVYFLIIIDNKVFKEENSIRGKGKSQCNTPKNKE
jgi:hypothetical protein